MRTPRGEAFTRSAICSTRCFPSSMAVKVQFDGGLQRCRLMMCVQSIENVFGRWTKRRGNSSHERVTPLRKLNLSILDALGPVCVTQFHCPASGRLAYSSSAAIKDPFMKREYH